MVIFVNETKKLIINQGFFVFEETGIKIEAKTPEKNQVWTKK